MHHWLEYILVQLLQKTLWRFLKKKLKMEVPHDPAIPLLGIYPKETELLSQRDNCTHVHWHNIYNSQDMKIT